MRLCTLGFALLAACLTMPAAAQESITRAEESIRLQEVPLAMPVSFERAYSPEQVDFLAWIATRALDPTSSAWNPRRRAWLAERAISLDAAPSGYAFHLASARALLPSTRPDTLAQVDPETVNVPEQYDTTDMTTGDAVATVKACAPSVSDATASALAERVCSAPASTLHALSSPGSHTLLLIRQRTAACIPTTPPGYPVLAASSFVGTIRVIGMDPGQERAWRIAIAQEIAAFGASDSLVVMRNGNALEVNYAVNAQAPHALVYSRRFLRKGTYDPTRYRIVQRSDQYTSVELLQLGSGHEVRFEKALHSTPEELAREQERRNRDAKPSP